MPCTGLSISAPAITCLDFLLEWDLSGAQPTVKITNNSTVVTANKLKWWFYVTGPSGAAIYGVDVETYTSYPTPDVNLVAWTTKTINLPSPFTNSPCGQIEFSPTNPYTVEVFVQDMSTSPPGSLYSYSKTTIITRPNGNTIDSCGNFGKAAVSVKVDCGSKNIMCFDGTNLAYNNILTPTSVSNDWTLVYPQNNAGQIPNETASDLPNVNFVVGTNSKGYTLYFNETATYNYGSGVTVIVKYKLFDVGPGNNLGRTFAVSCNTNLCALQCQMEKYYELSKSSCGQLENAALTDKMVRLNWMFSRILTGIFQPLCGIDVPALIEEMKAMMALGDDCDCGCGCDDNFGFSNPTGTGNSAGGCCPVTTNVLDINTDNAPANCPQSYFPARVYSPDKSEVIGLAVDADSMVAILNSNAEWQVYGIAFNMGNCKVGWYKNDGIFTVPDIYTEPGDTIIIIDGDTNNPPSQCPGNFFPVTVREPDGVTEIGIAADAASLVALINGNTAWQAYGTAYFNGTNCTVAFIPTTPGDPIPPIIVDDSSDCVGGIQNYNVTLEDICGVNDPPITASSLPFSAWVDFGSGLVTLGTVTTTAELLTALNGATGKPTSVTFTAGAIPGSLNYQVDNTDCAGYSGVIRIYTDANSGGFMLYEANHRTIATPQPSSGGVYGVAVKTSSVIGRISGISLTDYPWHVTKLFSGPYMVTACGNTGRVYCWDITSPLTPVLIGSVLLNNTGGPYTCFSGVPQQFGVNMYFSLYFPTDYHTMDLTKVYVCEALTGSIWQVDFSAGGVVVKSFQNAQLIGKCPRVVYKGDLYYTQDGNLESVTIGSGVLPGEIVRFRVSDSSWTGGSINTDTIIANQTEEVWAASWDSTAGLIYFTGQKGTIVTHNPASNANVNTYALVMGQTANKRLNSRLYLGKLYLSTYGGWTSPGGLSTGTRFIDVTTLGTTNTITNLQAFTRSSVNNITTHWNFLPLGNCLGVLTYENEGTPGSGAAGLVLFRLDGTFVRRIDFAAGATYNVVPIPGVSVYTPTSLIP